MILSNFWKRKHTSGRRRYCAGVGMKPSSFKISDIANRIAKNSSIISSFFDHLVPKDALAASCISFRSFATLFIVLSLFTSVSSTWNAAEKPSVFSVQLFTQKFNLWVAQPISGTLVRFESFRFTEQLSPTIHTTLSSPVSYGSSTPKKKIDAETH